MADEEAERLEARPQRQRLAGQRQRDKSCDHASFLPSISRSK
jgi:hypothetical protein